MRELNECKAEVFRRSEQRIKERRKRRRILALCMPLCVIIAVLSVTVFYLGKPDGRDNTFGNGLLDGTKEDVMTDADTLGGCSDLDSKYSFSFSITWGCGGVSSYDSVSGKLVKTTDASRPEDYVTYCQLGMGDTKRIRELLLWLDVSDYPDNYDPQNNGLASDPSMTLMLTVKTADTERTVKAENVALSYEADNPKGQRFLSVCKEIIDILTATEEWKALPDYEFLYD